MGLFDNQSSDHTGTTQLFTQQAQAFAKLDLNTVFKMGGQAISTMIDDAVKTFKQLFGHSDCNDQDRVLVERFIDQIPGMAILLSDLGYLDPSVGDQYRKWENDPAKIAYIMEQMGRPRGPEPCNSLLGPARLIWTILFGVRITNSNFLDALDRGVDDYYNAAGNNGSDIPRKAVERAVMLKQNFYPSSTYNKVQWDLNHFQDWPLVAPVPDPDNIGVLYSGQFMGVTVVNGRVIGDPIPDVQAYVNTIPRVKPGTIIDLHNLPSLNLPGTGSQQDLQQQQQQLQQGQGGDLLQIGIQWAKSHPLQTVGIFAALAFAIAELIED